MQMFETLPCPPTHQQVARPQAAPSMMDNEDDGRYPGGIEIPAFLRRRRLQGK